jgi:hypothetical protein
MKIILALIFTTVSGIILTGCLTSGAKNNPEKVEIVADDKTSVSNRRTPVLVELFTSEGCSSCPPADRTLELLASEQPFQSAEIIALSQHVDYWNRLGWTDPFSSAQFSQRQSEYADFFKRDDVYTPQMIVDGTREFVGSNMREAQKAITEAANTQKADVELSAVMEKNNVALKIKIENLPDNFESANVLLAVTEDNLASSVPRGENAGRKLTHVAVVRSLTNIANVKNGQKSFEAAPLFQLDKNWKKENLSAVVFVQETKSRQVLGVSKIKFN